MFSSSSASKSISMFSHLKKDSYRYTEINTKNLPNPNPSNYKIIRSKQVGKYLVIKIKYSDCTNYEGNKILIFRSTLEKLKKQKLIDPHFSENKNFISPIARFEPTFSGWINALSLVEKILK